MLREFAEQALTRLKYQPIMPVAASGLLMRIAGTRARTCLVTLRCLFALAVPGAWIARALIDGEIKFRFLPEPHYMPHRQSESFALSLFCYLILLVLHDAQQVRDLTHMKSLSPLTHVTIWLLHILTMSVLIASCISEILLRVVGIETDPNHLPVEFWISLSAALSEMLFSRFTFPKLCHYFVVPVWLLLGVSTALIFYMGPISVLATSYRWTLSLFGVGLILLGFTLVVCVENVRDWAFPVGDGFDWGDKDLEAYGEARFFSVNEFSRPEGAEKEKWNDESCIALLDSSFLVAALTEGEDDEKA